MTNGGVLPTAEHYSELTRNEAEVIDKLGELTAAEAKLLLLNEREAHGLLRQLHEDVIIYSTEYLKQECPKGTVRGEKWSLAYLERYKTTLRDRRDAFFAALSSAYDRT